jgi:hypothetical protein
LRCRYQHIPPLISMCVRVTVYGCVIVGSLVAASSSSGTTYAEAIGAFVCVCVVVLLLVVLVYIVLGVL